MLRVDNNPPAYQFKKNHK